MLKLITDMVIAEKERVTGQDLKIIYSKNGHVDETSWQVDTPYGRIYGVDSNEAGKLPQRRVWLPYEAGSKLSLREKFSPYLGEQPFTPYLAGHSPDHVEITKGYAGEEQVLLKYGFVRPVRRFTVVTQDDQVNSSNNSIPSRPTVMRNLNFDTFTKSEF